MPLIATRGAASAQGFGEFAQAAAPTYIEDVFSTYLYTGNGSTQTITNGIDLSGKGGLVWTKCRGATARSHILIDTVRGASSYLSSNLTDAAATTSVYITGFNANGYGIDYGNAVNASPNTFASWTFRKQPKFFDVVTYTGNGTTQAISHNLGAVPGFIIIKKTNSAEDWWCFHRYDFTYRTKLNATNAAVNTTSAKYLGNNVTDVAPTSTTFTVGDTGGLNGSGDTFVAYLFAHDAGGFGLTGSDNVISCGSWTGNTATTLGYEPQWLLIKRVNDTSNWFIVDNMRGLPVTGQDSFLYPNLTNVEYGPDGLSYLIPTATGFYPGSDSFFQTGTFIYVAIRRGPMKTPTSGTQVYGANVWGGGTTTFTDFAPDVSTRFQRVNYNTDTPLLFSRMTGGNYLRTSSTASEAADNTAYWDLTGGGGSVDFGAMTSLVAHFFRRAPGFLDVVYYTGDGVAGRTVTHNLTVVPEMMIVKARNYSGGRPWPVYHSGIGNTKYLYLNTTDPEATNTWWNNTTPTASVFTVGSNSVVNFSGTNYVAYLFATCPGVSKVGFLSNVDGSGTLSVNCGFTSGARFVLLKNVTNGFGWLVFDSTRGMSATNDPFLLFNSTAAENTTSGDIVNQTSTGFEIIKQNLINVVSNGDFIYLAIA